MLTTGNQRQGDQYPEPYQFGALDPQVEKLPALRPDTDAIGELLGEFPDPVVGGFRRSAWKLLRLALVLLLIAGISIPTYLLFEQQSRHVISKNAAVRAHLAEIGTRLRGVVAEVLVDVGDRVQAGQVLLRLDDRHLQAAVKEAQAEVESLQCQIEVERHAVELETVEIEQRRIEVAAITAATEANTEASRLTAEDARRDHDRREELFTGKGIVAGEEVREAKFLWHAAEARHKEAQATAKVTLQTERKDIRRMVTDLSLREEQISVLEAELHSAEARQSRAEADCEHALVRAPQDGAVIRRIAQPGVSVKEGQPMLALRLGDDMWVEAWIEQEDLCHIGLGVRAMVTFESFPGREFEAEITMIGLATDLEVPEEEVPRPRFTRLRGAPVVNLQLRLLAPPPNLLPGLSAVVSIDKQQDGVALEDDQR